MGSSSDSSANNYSHPSSVVGANNNNLSQPASILRWPVRRKMWFIRRRRLPIVRLGGGGKKSRRKGLVLVRMLKRVRLRWLKIKYAGVLKRLREYYKRVMKDIMEGAASIEAYQQRLLMETSFAIPVMGISFNTPYPSTTTTTTNNSIYMF